MPAGDRPEVGRAFVAVRPPEPVLDAVAERLRAGRPAHWPSTVRWAERAHWHLTLAFLGPVARLAPVVDALGSAAASQPAFPFQLAGAGAFPDAPRARVLWLGAGEGTRRFVALAAAVAEALEPLGHPRQDRPYHPHLTVARRREPAPAGEWIRAIGPEPVGAPWTVREVVVYQSRTAATGPTYTVLEIGRAHV